MNNSNSIRIWDLPVGPVAKAYPNNVLMHTESGDILLLRHALQRAALWGEIQQTLWSAIEEALGGEAAARVREIGLGLMHQLLTADQIKTCSEVAHLRLNSITEHYVPALVREAIGYRGEKGRRFLRWELCNSLLSTDRSP